VLEFNKKPVHNSSDLITAVTAVDVGETVPVKISRNQETQTLSLKVGQRPLTADEMKPEPKSRGAKRVEPKVNTGLQLEDLTADIAKDLALDAKTKGVVIDGYDYDSAADRAGLDRGDLIVEVDKKPVRSVDEFYKIVKERKAYLLRVRRIDDQDRESFTVVVLDLKK